MPSFLKKTAASSRLSSPVKPRWPHPKAPFLPAEERAFCFPIKTLAPAAAKTIKRYFDDTATTPSDYDLIITGDLGSVGATLLRDLLARDGCDLREQGQADCGLMIYDRDKQDAHAGASGCGCSAGVMCGHILPLVSAGTLHNILFIATGALMSPTVVQQGESIASIAHLLYISDQPKGGALQ